MLVNIVVVIQILAALAMAGLVLVQHGKGADMGAAFGTGSAGSLFGASGSANFLSRLTAVAATVFFISTLTLAFLAGQGLRQPAGAGNSVLENAPLIAPVPESGAASAIPGLVNVDGSAPATASEPQNAGSGLAGDIPVSAGQTPPTAGEEAAPAADAAAPQNPPEGQQTQPVPQ